MIPEYLKSNRRARRLGRGLLVASALLALVYGGWQIWMHTRPQPVSLRRDLFRGVTYLRDARQQPRPMVIHVVTIDLNAPGIGFVTTPADASRALPLCARKTSRFLSEMGAQVAINADFFFPWYSHNLFSYYPHVGDPVTVEGLGATRGVIYHIYPKSIPQFPTLYLSRDNRARFARPDGAIYNAISGNQMLVQNGEVVHNDPLYDAKLDPRTAVGLDRSRRKMILVVVDGRQPNYSEGATCLELAAIFRQYGAWDAMNLDGGGSTTLAIEDIENTEDIKNTENTANTANTADTKDKGGKTRRPQILNCPIDCHLPNRERPVANHLGIFAQRARPK